MRPRCCRGCGTYSSHYVSQCCNQSRRPLHRIQICHPASATVMKMPAAGSDDGLDPMQSGTEVGACCCAQQSSMLSGVVTQIHDACAGVTALTSLCRLTRLVVEGDGYGIAELALKVGHEGWHSLLKCHSALLLQPPD
jgi:hypothetical protein